MGDNFQDLSDSLIQTQLVSFNGRKKPHACTKCEFSFMEKKSLEIHMVTAHGGNKPYECSECHSQFLLKSELRSHISLIHKGEKPIKCPICDETFVDKKIANHILRMFMMEKCLLSVLYVNVGVK